MDQRINRIAALANVESYNEEATRKYVDGAPHVKHAALRKLYGTMVIQVYDRAKQFSGTPKVLDLGAGEGSVTLPFLELGAEVTAVDISKSQLEALQKKCHKYSDMLKIQCADINHLLNETTEKFDIIVVNSFLHHVPDYLGFIEKTIDLLTEHGQFFSFQDPLRFDSVGRFTYYFTRIAYVSWRIFKGDVLGGTKRWLRRSNGVYLEDSIHDNAEYHAIRNGVDQDAIKQLFRKHGMACHIQSYFSTQSSIFQPIGSAINIYNTFGVIAEKTSP